VLFAFGDFAFNLFWQSVMLFLLFYYTESLKLPVGIAAFTYMVASVWDGFVNLAAGLLVDKWQGRRGHRSYLIVGAIPLGLAFVLTYLPPPFTGSLAVAMVFVGHLLFRTAYALLNVPYLAMTARISSDSRDRALIAGLRMVFGAVAAVTVALGTVPLGKWLTGSEGASAWFASACVFAGLGSAILLVVGLSVEEQPLDRPEGPRPSLGASLTSLAHNRAFLTLSMAMMCMTIAAIVLNKSVLYYFKYYLENEAAGPITLAAMLAASAAVIPLWVALCRVLGARAAWFAAVALGGLTLIGFVLHDVREIPLMQGFLIAMQVAMTGFNFVFWAMLPNTIEYGERMTGLRVEGTAFGLAALLQRVAIGAATGLLGVALTAIGYVADAPQSAATLAGLRWTVGLVPLGFLVLSAAFMLWNPLTRGAHAGIVAELRRQKADRGLPSRTR